MSAAFELEGRGMNTAVTVQQVLMEFAPLFGLSFSIFALKEFRMCHSTGWGGRFWMRLFDIILSSMIGGALIVGICIIIMSVEPRVNHTVVVGVAVFLSVGGFSLIDRLVHKYFGVRFLDQHVEVHGEIHGGRKGEDR